MEILGLIMEMLMYAILFFIMMFIFIVIGFITLIGMIQLFEFTIL